MFLKEEMDWYFKNAWEEAERSDCLKKKVGCVLVDTESQEIVSWGHGGAEKDCKSCVRDVYSWTQDGCWSIHSELRAIFKYFERYEYMQDLSHLVAFVTHGPCDQCLKYLALFKVKAVFFDMSYKTNYGKWNDQIDIRHYPYKSIAEEEK